MAVRVEKDNEITNWKEIYRKTKGLESVARRDVWRSYDEYLRTECLRYMGNSCESCGISDPRVLQITRKAAPRAGRSLYLAVIYDYDTEASLLCANCRILEGAGGLIDG